MQLAHTERGFQQGALGMDLMNEVVDIQVSKVRAVLIMYHIIRQSVLCTFTFTQ